MALPREKQASALCRPSMAMETPGQEGLNPDEPARTEPGRLNRSSSLCLPAAHRSRHRRRPPPSPCAPSPSPFFLSSPRSGEPANPSVRSWAARRRPPSSRPFGKGRGPGRCGVWRATQGRRWRRDEGTCDGAPANRGGRRRCCRSGARLRGEEEEQRKGRLEVILADDGGTQA